MSKDADEVSNLGAAVSMFKPNAAGESPVSSTITSDVPSDFYYSLEFGSLSMIHIEREVELWNEDPDSWEAEYLDDEAIVDVEVVNNCEVVEKARCKRRTIAFDTGNAKKFEL